MAACYNKLKTTKYKKNVIKKSKAEKVSVRKYVGAICSLCLKIKYVLLDNTNCIDNWYGGLFCIEVCQTIHIF